MPPTSMEELGLYGEQPDRKVSQVTPDEVDPSFSQVTFNDGTTETMPSSQASALPAEPPPMTPQDMALAGAPAPMDPAALAATGQPPAGPGYTVTAPGAVPTEQSLLAGVNAASNPPLPTPDHTGLQGAAMHVGDGSARVDPNAEIVAPGSPGGFGDFSRTTGEDVTNTETVDDAATLQGRVGDAYDQEAEAARLHDEMGYASRRDSLDTELDARDAQEAQLRQQMRQAELEREEHEKIVKAMEATPIDEDGFWSESPGRAAGAWIALALSGFLQGATRGQNPALNQMVQALNHAQDRYVDNQQKNRASALSTRMKLMGDKQNAIDSMKLQLSGVMEKRIMLDAQREGLQPPPSLATYLAQGGVKRAEAQNAIGQRVAHSETIRSQEEQRATAATGPVRRGDLVLQQLGVAPKAHADAMDPKGLNLGGVVAGADRLQTISKALEAVAARNGGSLPAQGTASWTQLGLAPLAARLGIKNAEEQVNTKQLLEEAKLAYKQTVNIKSIDSENEGRSFNAIMDSGEGQTTIAAVKARAEMANQSAISIASGVTRDTQGYIDFVRSTQRGVPGVTKGQQAASLKRLSGPDEAATVKQAGGGGPATRPLPESPRPGIPEPPSGRASETTPTSRPGTYVRLKDRNRGEPR
jgi:hypothetical protein